MRLALALVIVAAAGCNQILGNDNFKPGGGGGGGGGDGGPVDVPVDADPCMAQGKQPTTLSGTVFAPNGTLPIYNAAVYIPTTAIDPIPTTVSGPTCVSGSPPVVARTKVDGTFSIDHVIAPGDVMLVIQVGKWRREVPVTNVQACMDNPVDPAMTRLPATSNDGSMPQIAITTGAADAFECLVRDMGIPDTEFVAGPGGAGHVHLYAQNGVGKLGATTLPASATLFAGGALTAYDLAMFGCPGQPSTDATPANAAIVRQWTDAGGWVFLTHYDYQWFVTGPVPWPQIAQFNASGAVTQVTTVSIDTTTPIGQRMSDWMVAVGGSTTAGLFTLLQGSGRNSCTTVDLTKTARRMFLDPTLNMNVSGVQSFTWDAMTGGRATFDDVHVTGVGGTPAQVFPAECTSAPNTAQEKALMFQIFETPTCDQP